MNMLKKSLLMSGIIFSGAALADSNTTGADVNATQTGTQNGTVNYQNENRSQVDKNKMGKHGEYKEAKKKVKDLSTKEAAMVVRKYNEDEDYQDKIDEELDRWEEKKERKEDKENGGLLD